jgi:hypothetical protein
MFSLVLTVTFLVFAVICETFQTKVDPLEKGCTLFYIRTQSVARSEHSTPKLYETSLLMFYKPNCAVCSEIRTKHINAMWASFSIF